MSAPADSPGAQESVSDRDLPVGHHWQYGMLDGAGAPTGRTVGYCAPMLARLKLATRDVGLDAVRASGLLAVRCYDPGDQVVRAFELTGIGPLVGPMSVGIVLDAGHSTLKWEPHEASMTERVDAHLWIDVVLHDSGERLRSSEPLHLFGRARPPSPAEGHLRSSGETDLIDESGQGYGTVTSVDIDFGALLHTTELPDDDPK